MYFRQREDHYGVGSYHHEPIATPQIRAPGARRGPAAGADAVHPARLRRRGDRGRAAPPGAGRDDASGGPRPVAQRDVLVHPGRGLDRRRERARPRRLDLRGRLGHARGWDGPAGRRVDRDRRVQLRPGRGRREPLLPVPDDAAVRARAREAAVPRGVRHPASAPTARAPAWAAADAVPSATRGARRRVLHGRRVGAPAMVRREQGPERRGLGVPRGLVRAELVAGRRRRAPRDARTRGALRPDPVREARRRGTGRSRVPRTGLREPDRPQSRHGDLHVDAHALRRDPLRPDRDPCRRGVVHGRDRRRVGDARPRVAPAAAPRRRACGDREHDRPPVLPGTLGTARARRPCGRDRRRPGERRVPLHDDARGWRSARSPRSRSASATWGSSGGSSTDRSRWARASGICCGRPASSTD